MSDIPPRNLNFPHVGEELLWKILVKAEPNVVAKCKLLNTTWKFKLESSLFLQEHFNEQRNKTRSIIVGLGYPPTDQISNFFLRYDVDRKEQVRFVVPQSIRDYEDRVLIGSDHRILCIRASIGLTNSRILLWNPLTGKDRLLPHDRQRHCCIGWNDDGVIETKIDRLGPKSIMHNGCVHWLDWGGVQHLEATHVGLFDMENMTWYDTEVPERAKTTYHSLIEFNNGVGFISYQNVDINRSIQVWQLI
ncbi:hypothetical protein PIB30_085494 [Stylosanthes scabra]|uniref:F-box associated domain-containing protein n=1 Tax=Stylosanthes scabra TaxID=79078 RepID=A0ABU6ST40_9FABA|nr:hypothetical protein [Stylosanthes scabra]